MTPESKLWYRNLKTSPLSPPSYIFGIVWPILYALMFISALKIWNSKQCSKDFICTPIAIFIVHLFFNFIWTTLFFKWNRPVLSLIDIILLVVFVAIIIKKFYDIDKYAAYLLIPYLIWLIFASYLNLYIVLHNKI
jgi:tryptophan-rich sensory protein